MNLSFFNEISASNSPGGVEEAERIGVEEAERIVISQQHARGICNKISS